MLLTSEDVIRSDAPLPDKAGTSPIRKKYRSAVAQTCYDQIDSEAGRWTPEENRNALIEDEALYERLSLDLLEQAPTEAGDDPGWPGGWMCADDVHKVRLGGPRVWPTQQDALEAGAAEETLIWTPVCRGQSHSIWAILDDHYWAQPDKDVLIHGIDAGFA